MRMVVCRQWSENFPIKFCFLLPCFRQHRANELWSVLRGEMWFSFLYFPRNALETSKKNKSTDGCTCDVQLSVCQQRLTSVSQQIWELCLTLVIYLFVWHAGSQSPPPPLQQKKEEVILCPANTHCTFCSKIHLWRLFFSVFFTATPKIISHQY